VTPPVVPPTGCIEDVMGSSLWENGGLRPSVPENSAELMVYNSTEEHYSAVTKQDGSLMWPEEFSGTEDQSIAVTVSNFGQPEWNYVLTSDYVYLECRKTDNLALGDGLRVTFYKYEGETFGIEPFPFLWWIEYTINDEDDEIYGYYPEGPGPGGYFAWPYGPGPFRFALESDADGAFRVFVNDTLFFSDVVVGQPAIPSRVAVMAETNYGPEGGSGSYEPGVPWISDICVKGEV
jgi:hypothetical protein